MQELFAFYIYLYEDGGTIAFLFPGALNNR